MEGDLFGKISRPYIMPEERSIDINESIDFETTKFWMDNIN
jgi:CMP-N-acetylneuraminic acid synthetase